MSRPPPDWSDRLHALARRWATRFARSTEAQDDLAQAALARALETGDGSEPDVTVSQMRSLVRNAAKREWTRQRQGLAAGTDDDPTQHLKAPTPDPEAAVSWLRRESIIEHCLKRLSEVEQLVFTLGRAGATSAEIGAELVRRGQATSKAPGAVAPKRARARHKMALCIGASLSAGASHEHV